MALQETILNAGYSLVFLTIFIESGLFFGFVLPGDTLLIALGVSAAAGKLSLSLILITAILAAILGDAFGYYFGKRFGPGLFSRQTSGFFRKQNLEKAHAFSQRFGNMTILLGRFIPIVRTFAPIVAGVTDMDYRTFSFYNISGAIIWVFIVTLLGYFLGSQIPSAYLDKFVLLFAGGAFIVSTVTAVWHYRRAK